MLYNWDVNVTLAYIPLRSYVLTAEYEDDSFLEYSAV
jgi:hypothetical protein